MIKPISQSECADFLREFFSPAASVALAAELFRLEEEAQENICLGANICSRWEEFPSFQTAQAAVGGAYIPDGIYFSGGGFLMRK
jgi:hypothetical protein